MIGTMESVSSWVLIVLGLIAMGVDAVVVVETGAERCYNNLVRCWD